MTRWQRLLFSVAAVGLMILVGWVVAATAANVSHPTLDVIASDIAGHPVRVWCESSEAEWDARVSVWGWSGAGVGGFTAFGRPTVYIGQRSCGILRSALDRGYRAPGLYWLSGALLTLAHESVHQRGITDEGKTDCAALALVGDLADRYMGVTATMSVRAVIRATKLEVTVAERAVKNPDYGRLVAFAGLWHRAKPAAYQGGC